MILKSVLIFNLLLTIGIICGDVSGIQFNIVGLGPLNWVWKKVIIGSVKNDIIDLLTLKMKEELDQCLKKESIIEKMYIPILERKFSNNNLLS